MTIDYTLKKGAHDSREDGKVRVWTIRELRWKDKVTGEEIDDLTPGVRHALVRDEIPVAALPDLIEALEELADRWEAEQSDSDVDKAAGILSCEADLRTFIDTLAPREEEA